MARFRVALLVCLLAAGCLQAEDGPGDDDTGPGTPTASATATTTATTSSTPPPLPLPDEWEPGNWVNGTCPRLDPIMAPYFFHDLAARAGDRIVVLRSGDSSGSKYAVHAEGGQGTHFIAAAPGAVYAAKDVDLPTGRVIQYDADLKEVRSVQVGEVGSLHRQGEVLYVGGMGRLTTLALDLSERDVLDLTGTTYGAKRIDHIAIQNQGNGEHVAYLVDDVMQPFRLYRVDVTDPDDLRELSNHTVGSSTSPGPQWIDRAAKQWYVGTNSYGRGPDGVGSGETAQAIGLDGAPAEEPVPFHSGWTLDSGKVTQSGYDIVASTWYLPGWAVLHGNGSRMFSYVEFNDGVPSHACDVPMGAADAPAYLANDSSWFVAVAGDQLWYIDHTRGPTFGRTQTLPFTATGLAVLS